MFTKEQRERIELLQGTLDLLILRTLLRGPVHGHAIANDNNLPLFNVRTQTEQIGDGQRSRRARKSPSRCPR